MRYLLVLALASAGMGLVAPQLASASPSTVFCRSVGGKYTECPARFVAPMLVMQKSRAACIINNSWGYNPNTGYLWVSRGCVGVFADQAGYHHGQSGGMDVHARRYSNQGAFIGYGPLISVQKNVVNNQVTIQDNSTTVINTNHDVARITTPEVTENIDSTPQFDRNGNPNFDTEGKYIGPHGLGALVDAPPPEPEGSNAAEDTNAGNADDGSGSDTTNQDEEGTGQ